MLHAKKYTRKFKELIELERKEEMRFHENEIQALSGQAREKKGRALLNLRGRRAGEGLGGKFLVKFMKESGGELPETEISVGDLVILSRGNPLKSPNKGVVAEKTKYSITIAFEEPPPRFLLKPSARMDLYVNDLTFQRMLSALSGFEHPPKRLKALQGILLGLKKPEFLRPGRTELQNKTLNESQRIAVEKALSAKDLFLIHGPPGTGKTITSVEIIQQAARRDERVLATADSNIAVDNLVDLLTKRDVNVVRIGHPARVTPLLRKHTLDWLVERDKRYPELKDLRDSAFKLKEKQQYLSHPSMRWKRGMSDEKIRRMARKGQHSRGVPHQKIQEMAKWLEIQKDVDELFRKSNQIEQRIVQEILNNAEVICSTNSTSGSELLQGRNFDLLVIDEATQSTEPSCLIPILHARKIVMAGDHKQLPPTIMSQEAEKKGLSKTLFERLIGLYKGISQILEIQYRMHQDIMDFPNREFYDERLKADSSVRAHRLHDLQGISKEESPPLMFLDTSKLNAPERTRSGSTSKENPKEADLTEKIVERILNLGVNPKSIGIISPYDDQVDLLKKKIRNEEIEIKTVDGFQGREKELIVVSFVRSNPKGKVGFLSDLRRLNVSITRARRKLILVGNSRTISPHPTYKRFMGYIKERGKIFKSWKEFEI